MENARRNLLPGVTPAGSPPAVVFQSRDVIVRARRRAFLRDSVDLLLLAVVDWLFLHFPSTHIPGLARQDTLWLLGGVNALLVAYVWFARKMPHWTARRVATTWCATERSRFRARAGR